MRSSKERIAQLHKIAGRMARERAQRRAVAAGAGMAAVCLALVVALAVTVSRTTLRMPGGVSAPEGRMASIFVENGAVGYIFVAVLAFALGALFTVFCVRLRRLKAEKERDDDRKL